MVQVLVVAILLAAVVLWWSNRAGQKKAQAVSAASRIVRNDFHRVEVQAGVPACKAAQLLGSTRFLSDEAPICQSQVAPRVNAGAALFTMTIEGKSTAAITMDNGQTLRLR